MTRRVNSDLLLVGSLPADPTEGALRAAGEFFGDRRAARLARTVRSGQA